MTENEKSKICFECSGYGNDYTVSENGKIICCYDCWINAEVEE